MTQQLALSKNSHCGDKFNATIDKDDIDWDTVCPLSFSYFDENIYVENWKDFYIKFYRIIYDDYPDIFKEVVDRIYKYGSLKIASDKTKYWMANAVRIQESYYIDAALKPSVIIDGICFLLELCNVDIDNISICYREIKIIQQIPREKIHSLKKISFTHIELLKGYINESPYKAIFKGIELATSSWKELYLSVGQEFVRIYPKVFRKICGQKFLNSTGVHIRISDELHKFWMADPQPIGEGCYIDGAASPEYIITVLSSLLSGCGIAPDDLGIFFPSAPETEDLKKKQRCIDFVNWLQTQGIGIASAISIRSALGACIKYAEKNVIPCQNFYLADEPEAVKNFMNIFYKIKEFLALNSEKKKFLAAALDYYVKFLESLRSKEGHGPAATPSEKSHSAQVNSLEKTVSKYALWDEKEAALLIDACMQVQCKRISPDKAARELSDALRKRKQDNREEISNTSRRVNDISQQMLKIEGLLTGSTGHVYIEPIFQLMVKRYHENRYTFDKILKSAKEELAAKMGATVSPVYDSDNAIEKQKKRYIHILKEKFSDKGFTGGFRDKKLFTVAYKEFFGSEIPENTEAMLSLIEQVGVTHDNAIFPPADAEHRSVIEGIHDLVVATLNGGASCIWPQQLFTRYSGQLNSIGVFTKDRLLEELLNEKQNDYTVRNNLLVGIGSQSDSAKELNFYMESLHISVSYDTVIKKFWYIPPDTIQKEFRRNSEIVTVAPETYFYASNFPANKNEIERITRVLRETLEEHTFITKETFNKILQEYCPAWQTNSVGFTELGLRKVLSHLLKNEFYLGAVITKSGVTTSDIYTAFCNEHHMLTVTEIKAFSKEIGSITVEWQTYYDRMLRISENEFVQLDKVIFDRTAVDAALEKFCTGNYIPLKAADLLSHLPITDVKWTPYLLESFVYHHSRQFKLEHATFTEKDPCGAIVRKSSNLKNFEAVLIDFLARSDSWCDKNTALALLSQEGFLQMKKLSRIENIMSSARQLRKEKHLSGMY